MAWIGLADRGAARFHSPGLGALDRPEPPDVSSRLLPRGTLYLEMDFEDATRWHPLVDAFSPYPAPAALSLTVAPDGTVVLSLSQDGDLHRHRLSTRLTPGDHRVVLTYAWDAPAGTGHLGLWIPDRALWQAVPVSAPPALPLELMRGICLAGPGSEARLLAVAAHPLPAGPLPSLPGSARIATPEGETRLQDLAPGHLVETDAGVARVIWAGSETLPARGRFAPLRLRAPYFGAARDLILAPSQRLHLAGSEVEYLFGEEFVLAEARHLADQTAILPVRGLDTVRYHQILLDRAGVLRANGCPTESFDAGPLLTHPGLRALSLLSDLPARHLPRLAPRAAPMLRGFEAVTLTAMRAS